MRAAPSATSAAIFSVLPLRESYKTRTLPMKISPDRCCPSYELSRRETWRFLLCYEYGQETRDFPVHPPYASARRRGRRHGLLDQPPQACVLHVQGDSL